MPNENVENSSQLLERVNKVMGTIVDYKNNLHPEPYREMLEDLTVLKVNLMQLQSLIDDSVLHRSHSVKELFEMVGQLIK